VISALLFGAVEIWSASVMLLAVFTAGLIWFLRQEYNTYETASPVKLLIIIGILFTGYIFLQLIPLPADFLKFVSPAAFDLKTFYSLQANESVQISMHPYRTFLESLRLIAFLTVFVISAHNFRDRNNLKRTLVILLVFGFSLALFGIVQKSTWNEKIYWFRELTTGGHPFGPFVDRNHFAGFVGMIIPLGLAFTLTRHSQEKKMLFGFTTVIMAVALFFSLSRGGIVSFVAGMSLFSILIIISKADKKKIWAVGFFLTVIAAFLIYFGIDPVIKRFYAPSADISNEARLVVWSSTWKAFTDFPITGSGLGTFVNVFHLYMPPEIKDFYDHAHNDYLEFMLETGIIGIVFLLSFITVSLYALAKSSLQGRTGILLIGAVSSVFTMVIHSIFEFNLHILSNALLFSTVFGMMIALAIVNAELRGHDEEQDEEAYSYDAEDDEILDEEWKELQNQLHLARKNKSRRKTHRDHDAPQHDQETEQAHNINEE
jgi:O-antigen ligase